MAVTTWSPGQVLAAQDLNDTFASKLDLAGGKILQIVRATDSTDRTTTSTAFVDVTGLSVTITPQKSDSAILVIGTVRGVTATTTTGDHRGRFVLTDNSNNTLSGASDAAFGSVNYSFSSTATNHCYLSLIGYSTPATTSATTYKMRFRVDVATTSLSALNASAIGQIYAIEVSA